MRAFVPLFLLTFVPFGVANTVFGSVIIGGRCTVDADCVGDPGSSLCSSWICACQLDFIAKLDLENCLPIGNVIGDICEEPQQCNKGNLGDLSTCSDFQCACTEEAVKVPLVPECLLKATKIGDDCEGKEQCTPNLGAGGVCTSKMCGCDSNYVEKGDQTKCLEIVNELAKTCEESLQCEAGTPGIYSECSSTSKTCVCKSTAINAPGKHECLLKTGLGGTCTDDVQCAAIPGGLAECSGSSKRCNCKAVEAVPSSDGTGCLPVVNQIGGGCSESPQCQQGTPGPHSSCFAGTCQCGDTAIVIPGEQICYGKATLVGDPCQHNDQCRLNLGSWSECAAGVCRCSRGSVESSDKKKCLPGPVLIGDPCDDSSQCVSDATCSPSGHCTCRTTHIPNLAFNRCLPKVNTIGGTCEEANQCQQGTPGALSDCVQDGSSKVCRCNSDAVTSGTGHQCLKKASFVGDVCSVDNQCLVSLGFSQCVNQRCVCATNYVASQDNSRCLLRAYLGQSCSDHGQCRLISYSASCELVNPTNPGLGKICKCSPGYQAPSGGSVCYRMATAIGGACNENDFQCSNLVGPFCVGASGSRACHCDYTTTVASLDRRRCLSLVPNLNQPCEEPQQCKVANADCSGNQCICKVGEFVESLQIRGTCIQIRHTIGDLCTETIQCSSGSLGQLSECRGSRCECGSGSAEVQGRCYSRVPLSGRCSWNEECFAGSNTFSFCNSTSSLCQCLPGTIMSGGACWPRREVGDPCATDAECVWSIGQNSTCVKNVCACEFGFVPEFNNRICVSSGNSLEIFIFVTSFSLVMAYFVPIFYA